jgi:hypothetical protein
MSTPPRIDSAVGSALRERLQQVWSTMEPSAAELASARAKFLASGGARPRSSRATPRLVAVTVVLVAAAASAAERIVATRFAATPALPRAALGAPREPVASSRRATTLAGDPATPRSAQAEDLPGAAAEIPEEAAPAAPSRASHAPAPAVDRARVIATANTPVVVSAPVSPSRPWVEAASAMRAGDYGRAELAFDELARSGDLHARDAARLARAQVWIAQGRAGEARQELTALAASAATAPLREAASNALDELSKRDSSPGALRGTNLP